jgi:Cu+-exporting ATPase
MGRAIADGARQWLGAELPAVESFASTQGLGVHGVVDVMRWVAGRPAWLAEGCGRCCSPATTNAPRRLVAAEVGIAEVIAEVLPHDKVAVVRRLQRDGRVVAWSVTA